MGVNPLTEFKNELTYMETDLYKEVLLRAMQFIPDYFWVVPASTSGRHHPAGSLGEGGLKRHTQAAFRVAQETLSHPMFKEMFTPEERDAIRSSVLLHDTEKQGETAEGAGYETAHPILVRAALDPHKDGLPHCEEVAQAWNIICDLIDTHMGPWNTDKSTGVEFTGKPETPLQLFVHYCDYLSSRKGIDIEAIGEYKPDWTAHPATEAQVNYVAGLMAKCDKLGIEYPSIPLKDNLGNITLKKGEASAKIGMLKGLLEA